MLEDLGRPGFDLVGHRLDVPRATEGIDGVDNAGLLGDHLLGAQGDLGGVLGGQGVDLVQRVGVEALRTSEDGGQCLDRRPNDVVLRLLGGQRHAGRL